jgi:uncharacterized membrane protein
MRKVSILTVVAIVAALVVAAAPQSATAKGKSGAHLRWHGTVVRVSEDGSVYTVRKGNIEKPIHVSADTKYTKTEGKKAVDIDKGEIKEGDDVICLGKADEKGDFMAERIDKRLAR